jgi:hypothetical protein
VTAILGTWNPGKWRWDGLADDVEATEAGSTVCRTWSVSNRRHGIAVGDRIYLLKQGVPPRGIVASGTVTTPPFEDAHWNGVPGATTNYVEVALDVVLDPEDPLPTERLVAELVHTHWHPQSSGSSVHPRDEETLAAMWTEHVGRHGTLGR